MGRLSEYVNGSRGRSTFLDSGSSQTSGGVEISGFTENIELFGHLLTTDPDLAASFRKVIRKALSEARSKTSKDLKDYLENDPRDAYKAVRHVVYKRIFGGNVNILKKRRAGARYELIRPKKLKQGQRGGNRRPRVNDDRNRLETYYGSDRGFILRFLSSGTKPRMTRYGNRGLIPSKDIFGHSATWHVEQAVKDIADNINEYINKQING